MRVLTTEYEIRLTDYSADILVRRILDEGLGDWCVLQDGDAYTERKIPLQHPLLYVTDIHTNTKYTLTKSLLTETVNMIWIEFPWAVNWEMYDLDVLLLTDREMDVLIQFACFDDVVYPYPCD